MKCCGIFLILASICLMSEAFDCPVVQEKALTDQTIVFQGLNNFTLDFLHETIKRNTDKNVFFSPMSIYRTMLLAYIGSHGATEQLFHNRLYLDWSTNKNQVVSEFMHEKKLRSLNSKAETDLTFDIADKFFFDNEFKIRGCMKDMFADEIELLDIHGGPEAARKHINAWIEDKTHNHIQELLPPDSIQSDTKMAITNAAYFEGSWTSKFEKELTTKKDFHKTPSNSVQVDMMKHFGKLHYGSSDELNCHVVRIPYLRKNFKANDISFMLFLPKENKEKALEEMIGKMTPEVLSDAMRYMSRLEVNLELPKFTFEETTELKNILVAMGFGDAFSGKADFSGFSEASSIGLDNAYHKAKIQVDEEGTIAAAATVFTAVPLSGFISEPDPKVVHADHPFLFMLYDRVNKAVLFTGVYRGP